MQHAKSQVEVAYLDCKRNLTSKEQQCYELQTRSDVNQAELRLLQRENTQYHVEIQNLRDVVNSLEQEAHHAQQQYRIQLEHVSNQHQSLLSQIQAQQSSQQSLDQLTKQLEQAQQYGLDQELACRQLQWEYSKEQRRLQQDLGDVIKQFRNSSQDVIDRALIANLVVSYFKRNRYVIGWQLDRVVCSYTSYRGTGEYV
jgi:hypothetical protein